MGRLALCSLNKQITVFREQASSVLPWSNSNSEVLVFVVEPGEKPQSKARRTTKSTHIRHWAEIEPGHTGGRRALKYKRALLWSRVGLFSGEVKGGFFFYNELYIVFLYFTFRLMKVNPQWSGYPGYTFLSLTWQPLCKPPVGRTAGHWIAPLSTLQSPNTGPQRRWLRGHIPVVLWVDCTWKGPRGTWRQRA